MTHIGVDLFHALREGFFMLWETFWALVLGFGLSGAIQSFVSREEMQRALGGRGLRETVRAAGFGAASSSCSYAASAMAKTLFQRGADFVNSMVFMFASTNLVIELGIVLWILVGWQFAAAEVVGGILMIALFSLAGRRVFPQELTDEARTLLIEGEATSHDHDHDHDHEHDHGVTDERLPLRRRLASVGGWADASSYALADATMLRKEMAIGYGVAGALAVLVPTSIWRDVFLSGHGFWTSLENVIVGPLIAVLSFVCSVGNVPLAAALWQGGISFGGVVSFIFADLITLPLLLIYRRYYGGRITLRLLGVFWAVMSLAGLCVEYLFRAVHIAAPARPVEIIEPAFLWNYTTFLNIVFALILAAMWWLAHNQERFGGGAGYAIDPVCGMQVETAHAAARASYDGRDYVFCSDRCRERFEAAPERFAGATRPSHA